ncbi:hypothetical protein LU604_17895 [Erwinia tracheiphila]|uniref:ParB/RepB/Spo0J family partition protein n=1 Tax=Erwinia tracheiphila TaxID=65700 RepID=A0A345CNN4_9GAMM|nr:hypothetical protein [Erwinia tracheiphila]AXF75051.1 hypothetical protein AV903_01300 [Erwinia tracheiphila]UIA82407.1 hypothetical protein LU604_17895 [Erwinia tracheiphila]
MATPGQADGTVFNLRPSACPVPVKIIDKSEALAASISENNDRVDMHLSDLIFAVNELVSDGESVEVAAVKFGYKAKYIRKLIKLANMAPELLALLREDKVSLDQLIALSITDDHSRQLWAWNNSYHDKSPKDLRRLALNEEQPVTDNKFIKVVGMDAYCKAGGEIKHDLFSQHETHGGYITNPALVQELALSKLQVIAEKIAKEEGWSWSGFQEKLESWGDDSKRYEFPDPDMDDYNFTMVQKNKIDAIQDELEKNSFAMEAADEIQGEEKWVAYRHLSDEKNKIKAQLRKILDGANLSSEYKSERGVIVSISYNGDVLITRGLMKLSNKAKKINKAVNVTEDGQVSDVTQVSAALARSLSCERTLAVQAALMQKPEIALALMVHKMALSTFSTGYHASPVCVTVQQTTRSMADDAPGSAEGEAVRQLNEAHARWESTLPKGWENDFTLLTVLSIDQLLDLQAFCVASTLDGSVSRHEQGKVSALQQVEFAMNFNIHDYWKPTAQNFWGRLKKDAMLDQLTQTGVSVNREEFMALKKSDAAKRAESLIDSIQWLPEFM